jgi:hypothetical protein
LTPETPCREELLTYIYFYFYSTISASSSRGTRLLSPLESRFLYGRQRGRTFTFRYILGLPYPLRDYDTNLDLGVIGGVRSLTTEEFALVREERQQILEKYRTPSVLPEPEILQLLLLKRYQEANLPNVTINSILWSQYFHRLRWTHRLDNERVPPCKLSVYLDQALRNEDKPYDHKINSTVWYNLSSYILYGFEDWVEARGNILYQSNQGPPFWIDLWDPEAIRCAEDREADNHPRAQLKKQWEFTRSGKQLQNPRNLCAGNQKILRTWVSLNSN